MDSYIIQKELEVLKKIFSEGSKANTHYEFISVVAKELSDFLGAEGYRIEWNGEGKAKENELKLEIKVNTLARVNLYFTLNREVSKEEEEFLNFVKEAVEKIAEKITSYNIYKTLLDSYPFVAYFVDAEPPYPRKILYVTPNLEKWLGWKPEEISPDWWVKNLHPKDRENVLNAVEKLKKNQFIQSVYRIRKKDGSYVWVYATAKVVSKHRNLYRVAGYWVDITKLKELEERLKEEKQLFETLAHSLPVGLLLLKGETVLFVNEYALKLTGYTKQEVMKKSILDLLPKNYRQKVKKVLENAQRCLEKPEEYTVRIKTKGGEDRFLRILLISFKRNVECLTLALFMDITQEILLRRKVYYLAFYDQTTGLPNRHLFLILLERLIQRQDTKTLHLSTVNLTNLGEINFLYGFDKGDEVLKNFAKRLKSVSKDGIAARLSGKVFGLALRNKDKKEVAEILKNLSDERVENIELEIKAGVSSFPEDGYNPKELLEKAEMALIYSEGNVVNFYKREYEEKLRREIKMKEFLEESIERKDFRVVYQPIVSLRNGKTVGAEVLVRWYHRELGEVPPGVFIPIAEKYRLVSKINYIVMEKAFNELSEFVKNREFFLSVNVNAEQFYSEELINKLEKYSEKCKFPLNKVILELTERTLMEKSEKAVEILSELKSLGVKIAIDDFGTGYSSMHYLVEFNVDEIKIDKSFIDKILENVNAWQVVRNIIELSHNLGTLALAEGVESEEQVKELKKLLCDEAQGYYFSPPLPFEKLIEFVKKEKQNLIK